MGHFVEPFLWDPWLEIRGPISRNFFVGSIAKDETPIGKAHSVRAKKASDVPKRRLDDGVDPAPVVQVETLQNENANNAHGTNKLVPTCQKHYHYRSGIDK